MADPIQSNSGQASGTANNVRTLSGVAAGDTLVACYISDTSTTQPSVPTDSSGQTWTLGQFIGGNSVGVSIWYLLNANSGTHTLTFTAPASTTSSSACLSEFGPATATDVIPAGHNGNGQTSPYAGLSITPTQSGDIVVYALGCYVGATITWTVATGYTTCGSFSTGSSDPPFIMAVKDVTGTATETPSTSWTGGTISGFGAVMMSFKTAAAAAPQPWTDPWDWHPDEVEDDLWWQQLDAPVSAPVVVPPLFEDPWPWSDADLCLDEAPEAQDDASANAGFVDIPPPADDWPWDEDVGDEHQDQLPGEATIADVNRLSPFEDVWPWDEWVEDSWPEWQDDAVANSSNVAPVLNTVTWVQTVWQATGNSPVAQTITVAPGAQGPCLVVLVYDDTNINVTFTVSSSINGAFTPGAYFANAGGANVDCGQIFTLLNASPGTHTITLTSSSSGDNLISLVTEYDNVLSVRGTGQLATVPWAQGTDSNNSAPNTVVAGDLLVTLVETASGTSGSPGTGTDTHGTAATQRLYVSDQFGLAGLLQQDQPCPTTGSLTSHTGNTVTSIGFGTVLFTAVLVPTQNNPSIPFDDPWPWDEEAAEDLVDDLVVAVAAIAAPALLDDAWPWSDADLCLDEAPEGQDDSAPVSTFVALAPPDDPWQHWDDEASDDQAVDDAPIAAESVLVQPADDWAWDEDVGDDLADQLPSDATSSDTNPIVAPLELDWPWDEDHEDRWEDWQADSTAVAESPLTPPDVDWDWSEDQADEVEAWQADSTPAAESPITPADVDWDWNEDQADEQESWQSDAMPVGANLPVTTPGPDDQWDHVDEVPDDWIEWPEPSSAPVVADVIPPPADVDWNWDEDVADEVPVDDQAIAAESVLEAPTDEWDWYGDDAAHDDAPEWQDDATPVGTFIAGPAIPDEWPHDDDDADDWWHQGEPTSQPTPPDVAGYPVDDAWPWQDDEGAPDDQPEWQDDSQSIPASVPPNPALNLEDAWDWSDADNLVDDWESWEDQSEPVGLPGPTPPAPAPAGLNPLDPLLAARRQWANLGVKWGSKPDLVLQAKTKAEVLRLAPVARALNVALELGPLPGPVVARIAPDPWRISITLPTVVAPAKPEEKPEAPRWTPPPEPEPPPPPPPEDPQVAALRREIASLKQMVVEAQRRAAIKAAEAALARDIARADGDAALERVQEERRKRNQRIAAELAARLYFRKP
jgi:hypothetical protein